MDYLKYDYCGYLDIEKDSKEETIQEPYIVMRNALDKVKRDIVFCVGYGAPNVWNWAAEAGGNQWRTTRDITDEWNVVTAIGTSRMCVQMPRHQVETMIRTCWWLANWGKAGEARCMILT